MIELMSLYQILKELEIQAIESKVFIQSLDGNLNYLSGYQEELDLEINSKESV